MRTKRALLGVLVAGVVTAGAVLPALAQDAVEPITTGVTASEASTADDTARERRGPHGPRSEEFAADLAEELGLSVDEVTAAIDAVTAKHRGTARAERTERLEGRLGDAVAAGELTQEQADAILDAHDADVMPFHRGEGPGGRDGHGGMRGRAMLGG
jgi:hypothetical protein